MFLFLQLILIFVLSDLRLPVTGSNRSGELVNRDKNIETIGFSEKFETSLIESYLDTIKSDNPNILKSIQELNREAELLLPKNPSKSVSYSNKSLELISGKELPKEKALAYYTLARGEYYLGDFYSSLANLRKAWDIYKELSDIKSLGKIHLHLGINYSFLNENYKSAQNLVYAIGYAERVTDYETIVDAYNNLGIVYRAYGEDSTALEYYHKALKISKEYKYNKGEGQCYNSLGSFYWRKKDFIKALELYQKSLEAYKSISDFNEGVAVVYNNMGNVFRDIGNYEKAIQLYESSQEISSSIGIRYLNVITLKNIAKTKSIRGQLNDALRDFRRAKDEAENLKLKKAVAENLLEISNIYEKLGDSKNSLIYLRQHNEIRDSLFSDDRTKRLLEFKYQNEKLEQEKKLQELELSQNKSQRYYLIVTIILGLSFTIIILNRYFALKRKNEENLSHKISIENLNRQLSQNESKYRNLFCSIMDAILVVDFDTHEIVEINPATKSLYGYDPDEIIGMNIDKIITEEFPLKEFATNKQHKLPIRFHKKKGGEIFPVEVILSTFYNSDRNLILASIRDISKRIRDDAALKKSELLFRSVWESSIDGMRIIDPNGDMLYVNDAFAEMIGKHKSDLLGRNYTIIYTNEYQEELIRRGSDKIRANQVKSHFEKAITLWDGRLLWFSLSNSYLEMGNEEFLLLSIFRDITEQKRIEIRIREDEERYRMLTENTTDVIWVTDLNLNPVYVSPSIKKFQGYEVNEFLSLPVERSLTPESIEYAKATLTMFMTKFEKKEVDPVHFTFTTELQYFRKDGTVTWGELTITPIINKNGQITGLQGSTRDINERKLNETKLKRYTEELQQSKALLEEKTNELTNLNEQLRISEIELKETNISKDKFFSIVAHDLKSPFLGLIGFSDILVEEFASLPNEKILEFLRKINKSIRDLYKLIEQLLEWSRLQIGKMQYLPNRIDIHEAIIYTSGLLAPTASNKSLKIRNISKPNICVMADEHMLHSVLENIITNAIKFSYPHNEILINAEQEGEFVKISVKDFGMGIGEEDITKLFQLEPYTRQGTAKEKGTGLGLMICKDMIEMHKGKIWLESELNKGTTFFFTIPKCPDMIEVNTEKG